MATKAAKGKLGRVRTGVQLVMLVLFPATFYYFSPAVSAMGAAEGVVTGSLLLFGLLFATSFVIGRLFCAWVCPGGAIGDFAARARPRRLRRGRVHWIKYLVWTPWLGLIIYLFVEAGGANRVEVGFNTVAGLSIHSTNELLAYLIVIVVFVTLSLAVGRRTSCHAICWMAPFMILGRSASNALRLPAVRLQADKERCIHCAKCSPVCPMSLDVQRMAERQEMDTTDCILCGACVTVCPKSVISWSFRSPQAGGAVRMRRDRLVAR